MNPVRIPRWRLDHAPVAVLALLAAIAAFAAIAACWLGDHLAFLRAYSSDTGGEHLFLSMWWLGLTAVAVLGRWRPSIGAGARAMMAMLGALCSGATLLFGFRGLAVLLSGFALIDLLQFLRSPRP
ncbi:hypothetical protein P6166_12875 [Stenotrophomonas sp. HITSZ_GD]|uniref:hypothetical protein n=1 Tax=Stenotrophomonas sp. HITSZ_GD TaxID=3037248 RepID=UPI00240D9B79|nr:hypothetical protein [Stenotrophomonas sp. HITSZ_GD]MDG2526248.1 hypothetical protein [Stenotrophomonas sp. HITSZ_GD]